MPEPVNAVALQGERVYALAGWPLDHSLSPAIHGAAFAAAGIDARYVLRPTQVADLPALVDQVRTDDLSGANVTAPHKVAALRLADEASELAVLTGAVNTLVRVRGGVRGENTDVAGFLTALHQLGAADGRGRQALVLGAGGAARAAVVGMAGRGYRTIVLARSAARAEAMTGEIRARLPGVALEAAQWSDDRLTDEAAVADVLVNATPIGSGADAAGCPWPDRAALPSRTAVLDLVSWPPETRLVTRARAAGARAVGGLDMLVIQAAEAWRLWTGLEPPVDVMRAAARAAAAIPPQA